MRKMRTVKEALTALKQKDKDFRLTEYSIRTLAKDKRIHTVTIGRRLFLDLDELEQLLCG